MKLCDVGPSMVIAAVSRASRAGMQVFRSELCSRLAMQEQHRHR
jgi:hypothetical protein